MSESGFIYTHDFLKKHYCSILEKNREKIAAGRDFLAGLRNIEPGLYIYPGNSFHITVLDILRGDPDRFLTFLTENKHKKFGTMAVTGAELVFHNWYDSKVTYRKQIMMRQDL